MKTKNVILSIEMIGLSVLLFAGCGSSVTVGSDSPVFQDCQVTAGCTGGEDEQYVQADLNFDRAIELGDGLEEEIRVVIGGNRIPSEKITAEQVDDDTVSLHISVKQTDTGELDIENAPDAEALTAITAESGSCAASVRVKTLIPSGAELNCLSSTAESSVYKVTAPVSHRSIIWIRVKQGDSELTPEGVPAGDSMGNAAAVHQHEFLWATNASTAEDIADMLNNCFGSALTASVQDDQITLIPQNTTAPLTLEIAEGDL